MENNLNDLFDQMYLSRNNNYNKMLNELSSELKSKFDEFISFFDKIKSIFNSKSDQLVEEFLYNNMMSSKYYNQIQIRSFYHQSEEMLISISGNYYFGRNDIPKIKLKKPVSEKLLNDLTKKMNLSDGDLIIKSPNIIIYNHNNLTKIYDYWLKIYVDILNSKLNKFGADKFNFETIKIAKPDNDYRVNIKLNINSSEFLNNNIKFFNEKYITKHKEFKNYYKQLNELENQIQNLSINLDRKILSQDFRSEIAEGLYQSMQFVNRFPSSYDKLKISLYESSINRCKSSCDRLHLDINNQDYIDLNDYPKDFLDFLKDYKLNTNINYELMENKLYIKSDIQNENVVNFYKNQIEDVLKYNNIKVKVNSYGQDIYIYL